MRRAVVLSVSVLAVLASSLGLSSWADKTYKPVKPLPPDRFATRLREMPSFVVETPGVSGEQAQALQAALGIPVDILQPDGSLQFIEPQLALKVPLMPMGPGEPGEDGRETLVQAFDFGAIAEIPVLPDEAALARTARALGAAELMPPGEPSIGHSVFEAFGLEGEQVVRALLDTQVDYALSMGGMPLVGPGAKVKLVYDAQGQVASLAYALRGVTMGPMVALISREEAEAIAAARILGVDPTVAAKAAMDQSLTFSSSLVYFAPSLAIGTVERIVPHFRIVGTQVVGGEPVRLRDLFIPAINDAPRVTIQAFGKESFVLATASVTGGRGPYSFYWSSSSTPLDPEIASAGPEIQYEVMGHGQELPEQVSVTVTDADGLVAWATATVEVTPGAPAQALRLVPGRVDVGTEWIGNCGGLGGSAANAGGFVTGFGSSEVPVNFNWGEQSAWERDFKDPSRGGDDTNWVDNADFVFYTGHANGNGFVFCSSRDDTFLDFTEARWGNKDLEWLTIAACGPLQLTQDGKEWWQRWGPAFDGLHLLMGYQTGSSDNVVEGSILSKASLGRLFPFVPPVPIRVGWYWAAVNSQPSSTVWAVMGVYGPNGETSYGDYFWGRGPVSPDLPRGRYAGWWMIWGGS